MANKILFPFLVALVGQPCLADPPAAPLPVETLSSAENNAVIVVGSEPGVESTVRQNNGEILEEFRRQGRLYRIRVTPAEGPVYELLEQSASSSN